jgi:hypothetical protein
MSEQLSTHSEVSDYIDDQVQEAEDWMRERIESGAVVIPNPENVAASVAMAGAARRTVLERQRRTIVNARRSSSGQTD